MPSLVARLYTTGQPVQFEWHSDRILQIQPTTISSTHPLPWLAPPLMDLQVNGFAGVDFQQDTLTLDALHHAVHALHQAGCACFFPTLITDDWAHLVHKLRHLRALRQLSPVLTTAIAGWHIEGPFLSADHGYRGAHDPRHMFDPTPGHIRELREAAGVDTLLLTIAPERPGALEAIELATRLQCRVSLGHTNASNELLLRASEMGAIGFTHLANACPQLLDRHDNILWRVLDLPEISVSLIPDGIHVSPPLFRLIHKALTPSRVYYVSDATAAAGAPPGSYTIGSIQLQVGPDQVVRQPGRSNFAGSALRPVDGVFRAAKMLHRSWRDCWNSFSINAALFAGIDLSLSPGTPAHFCLLDLNADQSEPTALRLFFSGQQVV